LKLKARVIDGHRSLKDESKGPTAPEIREFSREMKSEQVGSSRVKCVYDTLASRRVPYEAVG
jgi:hypothetical protein